MFLLDFSDSPERVPTIPDVEAAPFQPIGKRRRTRAEVDRLQRDPTFKFEVLRRYQGRCVLSGVAVQQMLDAAHVIPVEDGGPDDERNGLLLTAGLHRAFDAGLWAIHPETLRVVTRPQGPSPTEMGMKFETLVHVQLPPHREALTWRLHKFMTRNGLSELSIR